MKNPTRTVASIRDWRHNVTATVRWNAWRYWVTLRDDDSGNLLPVARVFHERIKALAYAASLVA